MVKRAGVVPVSLPPDFDGTSTDFVLNNRELRHHLKTAMKEVGGIDHRPADLFRMMAALPHLSDEEMYQTAFASGQAVLLWGYFHMGRFLLSGERSFHLAKDLAHSLFLTELTGVPCGTVRLPYRSIQIQLPPLLRVPESEGRGWCPVEKAFVSDWEDEDGRWLAIYLCGAAKEPRQTPTDSYWRVPVFDNVDISTIDTYVREMIPLSQMRVRSTVTADTSESMALATRLIVNSLLYISLPGADVQREGEAELRKLRQQAQKHPKKSKKRQRAQQKVREADKRLRTYQVGHSIQLPARLANEAQNESRRGRRVKASWFVRGHWRHQPHGPGRKLRKLIWIQPHQCRRDLAEVVAPPYEVK